MLVAQLCLTLCDPMDCSPPVSSVQRILQARILAAAAAKSLQSCPTLCRSCRRQPTRLPRPWDSPGKNTGVGCHFLLQCMKVKSESEVTQSCPTLIDPMDCSPPGSSIHGIFQARVLEWGAIAFSEEYWSGLLFPSPGDLPTHPGIKPGSPALQVDSLLSKPLWKPFLMRGLFKWTQQTEGPQLHNPSRSKPNA